MEGEVPGACNVLPIVSTLTHLILGKDNFFSPFTGKRRASLIKVITFCSKGGNLRHVLLWLIFIENTVEAKNISYICRVPPLVQVLIACF